ncbi:DUF2243 domain-containing protein [Roseomonas sp. BN140053]|uniref:DUF2243 domain-containing protein n=1 Tax=Roseomonas sp. BN140053 TaxID=3391898 RepID=UPI0039E85320
MSGAVGAVARPTGGLQGAGWVLGFALGGFFDGILLHQVLQWHHFLSLVEGEALRDIRTQILADGLFHVAVYAIVAVGLWLLWRARAGFSGAPADRTLLGSALLGFSLWQFVDVVVFHWIIGIHRIRVDVPDPLLWDVGWLVVTGLPPLFAGWWLRRHPGGGAPPAGGARRAAVPGALALLAVLAASFASLPPPGAATTLVLFRPGTGLAGAMAAVAAVDGRLAWADPSGELVSVQLGPDSSRWDLYRHGALLVGTSALSGGCLSWTRI